MATLDFGSALTLEQTVNLITAVPEVRVAALGEPGIGKSAMLNGVSRKLPNHHLVYCDCSNMDLGDTAMPAMDHEARVTRYYPNSRFSLHLEGPVAIMMDEFGKAPPPVQNMLHPLLEVNNPRLGDIPLPAGSIVFLTSNLATDGVGDVLKAHTRNRITTVRVRKPDADQWLGWAQGHGIDPIISAWVKQYPHALASYLDAGQTDNPYIYNPKKVQMAYVTPRSLERASHIVRRREDVDAETLIAGLTGTLGEAASRDMAAYVDYQAQLPQWSEIIANPKTCKLPSSPGACAVLVYGAVMKVQKDTVEPVMNYLKRFETEWQAVFAVSLARSPNQQVAFHSKSFSEWLRENSDVL